ncbi:GTP cyclohydrolase II [Actinospica durhamensis]|uniref:GTP cyclohydrolase-2 n=1 Tax=Actinospica durhamensis TaxID=1508375 RepID=A0A941ISQ1_9ACTN|nr:GTP cyclohydrolase II [Actinospica durhamensis]MBR7833471.1 GTP cyclohydrolase II [Actinospica durhamensis]
MIIDAVATRDNRSLATAARIRSSVVLPQHAVDRAEPARILTFDGLADDGEHIAMVWGPLDPCPTVRIHSECLTGDVLDSARCDCGRQLAETVRAFQQSGGILLYLRQEGRGIGLYNKIDAYALQDKGADTVDANLELGFPPDARQYEVAAQMLLALGHRAVNLVTNNPEKIAGLEDNGVRVARRLNTGLFLSRDNLGYLETKRNRMGHLLDFGDRRGAAS